MVINPSDVRLRWPAIRQPAKPVQSILGNWRRLDDVFYQPHCRWLHVNTFNSSKSDICHQNIMFKKEACVLFSSFFFIHILSFAFGFFRKCHNKNYNKLLNWMDLERKTFTLNSYPINFDQNHVQARISRFSAQNLNDSIQLNVILYPLKWAR